MKEKREKFPQTFEEFVEYIQKEAELNFEKYQKALKEVENYQAFMDSLDTPESGQTLTDYKLPRLEMGDLPHALLE